MSRWNAWCTSGIWSWRGECTSAPLRRVTGRLTHLGTVDKVKGESPLANSHRQLDAANLRWQVLRRRGKRMEDKIICSWCRVVLCRVTFIFPLRGGGSCEWNWRRICFQSAGDVSGFSFSFFPSLVRICRYRIHLPLNTAEQALRN